MRAATAQNAGSAQGNAAGHKRRFQAPTRFSSHPRLAGPRTLKSSRSLIIAAQTGNRMYRKARKSAPSHPSMPPFPYGRTGIRSLAAAVWRQGVCPKQADILQAKRAYPASKNRPRFWESDLFDTCFYHTIQVLQNQPVCGVQNGRKTWRTAALGTHCAI